MRCQGNGQRTLTPAPKCAPSQLVENRLGTVLEFVCTQMCVCELVGACVYVCAGRDGQFPTLQILRFIETPLSRPHNQTAQDLPVPEATASSGSLISGTPCHRMMVMASGLDAFQSGKMEEKSIVTRHDGNVQPLGYKSRLPLKSCCKGGTPGCRSLAILCDP